MREQDHQPDRSDELRPRAEAERAEPGRMFGAAAAGRLDAIGPTGILALQRTVGNAAVTHLIQRQRSAGPDAQTGRPTAQRSPGDEPTVGDELLEAAQQVQRCPHPEEDEPLQRCADDGMGAGEAEPVQRSAVASAGIQAPGPATGSGGTGLLDAPVQRCPDAAHAKERFPRPGSAVAVQRTNGQGQASQSVTAKPPESAWKKWEKGKIDLGQGRLLDVYFPRPGIAVFPGIRVLNEDATTASAVDWKRQVKELPEGEKDAFLGELADSFELLERPGSKGESAGSQVLSAVSELKPLPRRSDEQNRSPYEFDAKNVNGKAVGVNVLIMPTDTPDGKSDETALNPTRSENGLGTASFVRARRGHLSTGADAFGNTVASPPALGLGHELVHSVHDLMGGTAPFYKPGTGTKEINKVKYWTDDVTPEKRGTGNRVEMSADEEELHTVGSIEGLDAVGRVEWHDDGSGEDAIAVNEKGEPKLNPNPHEENAKRVAADYQNDVKALKDHQYRAYGRYGMQYGELSERVEQAVTYRRRFAGLTETQIAQDMGFPARSHYDPFFTSDGSQFPSGAYRMKSGVRQAQLTESDLRNPEKSDKLERIPGGSGPCGAGHSEQCFVPNGKHDTPTKQQQEHARKIAEFRKNNPAASPARPAALRLSELDGEKVAKGAQSVADALKGQSDLQPLVKRQRTGSGTHQYLPPTKQQIDDAIAAAQRTHPGVDAAMKHLGRAQALTGFALDVAQGEPLRAAADVTAMLPRVGPGLSNVLGLADGIVHDDPEAIAVNAVGLGAFIAAQAIPVVGELVDLGFAAYALIETVKSIFAGPTLGPTIDLGGGESAQRIIPDWLHTPFDWKQVEANARAIFPPPEKGPGAPPIWEQALDRYQNQAQLP